MDKLNITKVEKSIFPNLTNESIKLRFYFDNKVDITSTDFIKNLNITYKGNKIPFVYIDMVKNGNFYSKPKGLLIDFLKEDIQTEDMDEILSNINIEF